PAFDPGRASWPRRLVRWLFVGLAFVPLAAFALMAYLFSDLLYPVLSVLLRIPEWIQVATGLCLGLSIVVLYYVFINALFNASGLLFTRRRRQVARWRKHLAAVLSEHYGLAPGGLALFLEDNERFSTYLQHYLAEHNIPYPLPLYDRRGRYQF